MIALNKKGEEGGMSILVILIVGLIGLALVLGIIFRADILNWISNLPDYGDSDEDRVIDIDDDEVINGEICEEIGKLTVIKYEGGLTAGAKRLAGAEFGKLNKYVKIWVSPLLAGVHAYNSDLSLDKLYTIDINNSPTNLFVHTKDEVLYVAFQEERSSNIGQIDTDNMKVIIDNEFIDSSDIRAKHRSLPSSENLRLIDDASIRSLKICRKK